MKKQVYSFGGGTADGDGKMKDTLGGKGAGLAEMSRANVPVPPGFTISTEVCNIYFQNNNQVPAEINEQMIQALRLLGRWPASSITSSTMRERRWPTRSSATRTRSIASTAS